MSANHIDVKLQLWRRMSDALGADHYRITIVDRDADRLDEHGRGGMSRNIGKSEGKRAARAQGRDYAPDDERFFTADGLADRMRQLSMFNASGCDVYITPFSESLHYCVLDDLTEAQMTSALGSGFQPRIIQESSPGNHQLICAFRKSASLTPRDADELGNVVVKRAIVATGADPGVTRTTQPFRLPGFANRKPGKTGFFTRLLVAQSVLCPRLAALSDEIEQAAGTQPALIASGDRERLAVSELDERLSRTRIAPTDVDADAVFRAMRDRVERLAAKLIADGVWSAVDESAIDYRTARRMLHAGYPTSRVISALISGSPDLISRHSDMMFYAALTVQKAACDVLTRPDDRDVDTSSHQTI